LWPFFIVFFDKRVVVLVSGKVGAVNVVGVVIGVVQVRFLLNVTEINFSVCLMVDLKTIGQKTV
jgi:hypothetical protein